MNICKLFHELLLIVENRIETVGLVPRGLVNEILGLKILIAV